MTNSVLAKIRVLCTLRRTLSRHGDILAARRLWQGRPGGDLVKLHPRALRGEPVLCRPNTTDWQTFLDVFIHQYHMPRHELSEPTCIVDLGANAGYTAAHFASAFPGAKVIAVEMDHANWQLAVANVRPWRDRVIVVNVGVWSVDGEAMYAGRRQDGYHILEGSGPPNPACREPLEARRVAVKTIDSLVCENHVQAIDYMKVDIEGAEKQVLLDGPTDWLDRVSLLQIEVHPSAQDSWDDMVAVLRRKDLACSKDTKHWHTIIATRMQGHP